MSRRSKRKQSSRSSSSRSPKLGAWILRIALAVLLLLAVGSVGGYMWLRKYLSSKEFREVIVQKSQDTLRAETLLSPLRWDGFNVTTESFDAAGVASAKEIRVEGIKTGIVPSAVTRGVWSVVPSRVAKIKAVWDLTAMPPTSGSGDTAQQADLASTAATADKPWFDRWIPKKVETDLLIIDHSDVEVITADGSLTAKGTRWEIEPMESLAQSKIRGTGGDIQLPFSWAPPMRLEQMPLVYQSGSLFLNDSDFSIYESGRLNLGGEANLELKSYSIEGSMRDVLCSDVLPPDWRQRLSGKVEASFAMKSSSTGPVVNGEVQILQGTLTALPVLDKLAAYSQSLRFRTLSLHEARAEFTWAGNQITLRNVRIGSEGLARMEGNIVFTRSAPGQPYEMNGDFQVGLAPGTLAQIPGAEEDVFQPGPRGLMWAPMHLSGTLDDPKEDLSARLMAAAGARMFDIIPATGEKVLKYTQQVVENIDPETINKVTDVAGKVVDSAADLGTGVVEKVVDKGTETVEKAVDTAVDKAIDGVFGVFGGGGSPEPKPPVDPTKGPAPKVGN
jgi:hypothetical protein